MARNIIMKTLVILLAAISCTVADQILYKTDLPFLFDYSTIISKPVTSIVPEVVPKVVTSLPYYTGLKSQYYDRDVIGQAKYGHVEPGQSHHAVQDALGNKVGRFTYLDAEGKLVDTSYVADAAGYRVKTGELGTVDKILTKLPILDTQDLHAARIARLDEIEKIKARGKRDVFLTKGLVSPVISALPIEYKITPHALPTTITEPKLKPDGFLDDTPEVKFAKSRHFNEVETAKLRNLSPFINSIVPYKIVANLPILDTQDLHAARIARLDEIEKIKARGKRDVFLTKGLVSPVISTVPIDYKITPHALPTTITEPKLKPDGFLDDTPEVKFAKGRHFNEVENAKLRNLSPFIKPIVSYTGFDHLINPFLFV